MTKYTLQAWVFVLVAFMLGCNEYLIVGVLPDIATQLRVSLSSLGFLVTLFAATYAVSTPLVTLITTKFDRKNVLLWLMVVFFCGNTWTAFANDFLSLVISRMVTASVAGVIISLVLVFANRLAPRNKRASLVSWIFAGFSLASIIGVPLGVSIGTKWSWHTSFEIISVISLIVLGLLWWLLPHSQPQGSGTLGEQFKLFADRRVILGVALVVAVCAADYTFYTYIRPLFTELMHFDLAILNWLLFGMGIFFIIGNKLGGVIADHGGILRLPGFFIAMTLLLLLLKPLFAFPWLNVANIAIICVILACYGASTQILFLDIAEQNYPKAITLAASLNSIFANIGIASGSFAAATTVQFLGLPEVGIVGAIFGLLAIFITIRLAFIIKNK